MTAFHSKQTLVDTEYDQERSGSVSPFSEDPVRVGAGLAKRLASSLSGWKGSRRLATASRTPSRYRVERSFGSS